MKYNSPVISSASGSIAGITYSHNNGGNYTRARATPTNPNSTNQQAQRAALGAANAGWAALTDAQRDLWRDYAAATSWTDKLGNSITVTGHQAYVRWASVRSRIGESLNVAPAAGLSGFGEAPDGISIEITTPAATITFGADTTEAGDTILQLSSALSVGQNSVKRPLFQDSFGAFTGGDSDTTTTPIATLVAGERRVARARNCFDNGKLSQAFDVIVTIAAS